MKSFYPCKNYISGYSFFIICILLSSFHAGYGQNIDFGKSYINLNKGLNGGTIETNDTLEIRACVVVKSGRYDSCSYTDVIPAGTSYIPGTLRILTNEGKIYKQFTDAFGDDPGWITGSVITMNLGYNATDAPATAFRRGRIRNTHKPSFYGGTCIMIASYRVVVTAAIGSTISTGGGTITYKPSSASITSHTFPGNTIAIYTNYGVCSNAVGVNAIGTESNGTFGSGPTRNRGTSANVPTGYTYDIFTNGGPNDYYYGIANNTSTVNNYTTSNTWAIPDPSSPTHRVFTVWDIIGDHTGAADPLAGNPPTDTVANTNGGYMLVVNAAYRIDSAFQQTISGLCPNTYYEISCWMRNICSKCGCDSNGNGASSLSYIPTAAGDSSGVYPNITFEVNGNDYYTTGNIQYSGQWVKKGFTYLTKPAETSINLKFFNNAPGGGGNDWALDDITVATCSPNIALTPSPDPYVCASNVVNIGAEVSSFFNNYTYYKWQKSTDGGTSWADDGPPGGPVTPTLVGASWEYSIAYPPFVGTSADNGNMYKIILATTSANLTNPNCNFADAARITLTVDSCIILDETRILSFSGTQSNNAVLLEWTTDYEQASIQYLIEKSIDGIHFQPVTTINSRNDGSHLNQYYYKDPGVVSTTTYYRIRLTSNTYSKYSKTVFLSNDPGDFFLGNLANPFKGELQLELLSNDSRTVSILVTDISGKTVSRMNQKIMAGSNRILVPGTENLTPGIYILKAESNHTSITRKLVKMN